MIKIKMIIEEIEMKKFEETELKRLIAGCKERITLFDTEIKNIKDRKQKYDRENKSYPGYEQTLNNALIKKHVTEQELAGDEEELRTNKFKGFY